MRNAIPLLCLLAIGCKKKDDDAAAAAAAAAANAKKTEAVKPGIVGNPYETDCNYVFMAKFDNMGEEGEKNECEARDFEQNCAPDRDGCGEKKEKCKDACSQPCDACQAKCAATCTACKKGGDNRACAEARDVCRQGCLTKLNTCRDTICPNQEKACMEAADKERAKLCPDCEELKQCLSTGYYGSEATKATPDWDARSKATKASCGEKFPNTDPKCFELCEPDP